jgi:ABC-type transporter Mla subunit MlaD
MCVGAAQRWPDACPFRWSMPRPVRWPQLIPGILIIALAAFAVVAVFVWAKVGGIRGDTARLYATLPHARDVLKGTEVWLNGQKVGVVNEVRFQAAEVDTTIRLLVSMDVLVGAFPYLATDSRADVRPGGTLIGAPVVWLSLGTQTGGRIEPRDTIPARARHNVEVMTARATSVLDQLPALLADGRTIVAGLKSAKGSIAPLLDPERGTMRQVGVAQSRASQLMEQVQKGAGTTAARAAMEQARETVSHVTSAMDSVRQILDGPRTSLGRFRRDTSLTGALDSLRQRLAQLQRDLSSDQGTAGRFGADSALRNQMARINTEITALMADIKRRPLRYLAF